MAKTDGGPAFPVPNDANVNGQEGMSLRDWFAGMAMQSLIPTNNEQANAYHMRSTAKMGTSELAAAAAYKQADALPAQRDMNRE